MTGMKDMIEEEGVTEEVVETGAVAAVVIEEVAETDAVAVEEATEEVVEIEDIDKFPVASRWLPIEIKIG
jgi:hypothetical protein